MTLADMTQDKRLFLAERICEVFVENQAESDEAVAAIHIVMNLIAPTGLAIRTRQDKGEGGRYARVSD